MSLPNDEPWIEALITDTRKKHLLVPETASAQLQELLNGQLIEHQLTEFELRGVATTLIVAMGKISPDGEAKK